MCGAHTTHTQGTHLTHTCTHRAHVEHTRAHACGAHSAHTGHAHTHAGHTLGTHMHMWGTCGAHTHRHTHAGHTHAHVEHTRAHTRRAHAQGTHAHVEHTRARRAHEAAHARASLVPSAAPGQRRLLSARGRPAAQRCEGNVAASLSDVEPRLGLHFFEDRRLGVSRAEHVAGASGDEEFGVQSLASGTVLANKRMTSLKLVLPLSSREAGDGGGGREVETETRLVRAGDADRTGKAAAPRQGAQGSEGARREVRDARGAPGELRWRSLPCRGLHGRQRLSPPSAVLSRLPRRRVCGRRQRTELSARNAALADPPRVGHSPDGTRPATDACPRDPTPPSQWPPGQWPACTCCCSQSAPGK